MKNPFAFCLRLKALVYKEFLQLRRDPSSILIGAVLPILLILLMGYGISMDVKKIPLAVVMEDTSVMARDVVNFLSGSDYYSPQYVTSLTEGKELMNRREADAIIVLPPDFSKKLAKREGTAQIILYGVNPTTAQAAKNYIEAGFASYNAAHYMGYAKKGLVSVENRMWFNDANSSTWYFVPGLMMMVMTLVGVLLTALVMAKEWERGTLEAMFVTPAKVPEILLAKMIPYFILAMVGFFLCFLAARYLYDIPLHGSPVILLLSTVLYLLAALGLGLFISSTTKSQFLSCQIALMVGFLPSMMLSGFLFDLHSVPTAIGAVSRLLPQTCYLELLKTLFLAGNNWMLIGKNCCLLFLYGVIFLFLAYGATKKKVD